LDTYLGPLTIQTLRIVKVLHAHLVYLPSAGSEINTAGCSGK